MSAPEKIIIAGILAACALSASAEVTELKIAQQYGVSFLPGRWPMDYDSYLAVNRARLVTTIGASINIYAIE